MEKRERKIKNINLSYYETNIDGELYRICLCHDAAFFSDEALRLLLLSENGESTRAAIALSSHPGLKFKMLTL